MPTTVVALLLTLAIPNAFAVGSPRVLYLFGGCTIVLAVAFVAILLSKVRVVTKLGALVPLGIGVIVILGLNQVPDYDQYDIWIDTATLLVVAAAIAASFLIVRRASHDQPGKLE